MENRRYENTSITEEQFRVILNDVLLYFLEIANRKKILESNNSDELLEFINELQHFKKMALEEYIIADKCKDKIVLNYFNSIAIQLYSFDYPEVVKGLQTPAFAPGLTRNVILPEIKLTETSMLDRWNSLIETSGSSEVLQHAKKTNRYVRLMDIVTSLSIVMIAATIGAIIAGTFGLIASLLNAFTQCLSGLSEEENRESSEEIDINRGCFTLFWKPLLVGIIIAGLKSLMSCFSEYHLDKFHQQTKKTFQNKFNPLFFSNQPESKSSLIIVADEKHNMSSITLIPPTFVGI